MSIPETPSQVLRRAAGLMRARVDELPPSPWRAEGRDVTATQDYTSEGFWDWGHGYVVAACPRQDEAEHVASWSPPVALAVADWLDRFAAMTYCYGPREFDSALAIARAYLGETDADLLRADAAAVADDDIDDSEGTSED